MISQTSDKFKKIYIVFILRTLKTQLHDNRLKSDSQQETIHALQEQISQLVDEKTRLQKSLDEFIETLNREQAAHRENQTN